MEDYHQLLADSVIAHGTRLRRPIDYIEVGVLTGNSAAAVLATGYCRYATLIDNFSNTHCGETKSSRETVKANLAEYAGIFEIIVGDSNEVLPTITENFDIGFIDGDHSREACENDLESMFPLIRANGIIFVDDMQNPGYMHIKGVVEQFAKEKALKLTYHQVHNGVGELRFD
jgi:predicted O-methyltransferase YrrM